MKTEIILTAPEIMLGATAGIMRQVENIKLKSKAYYGAGHERDWQYNIEGALGEMALSKYLGVYWKGKSRKRETDVAHYDVRTSSRANGDLILHPDDPDDRTFWLLTGFNGTYTVHGCIVAAEGKKEEYWRDPAGNRPAFFVPQNLLRFP
jgi:hypothetical protein